MSRDKQQHKMWNQMAINYVKIYNESSKKNGADGAYNHLRGIRQEFREKSKKYQSEIQKKIKEIKPVFEIQINKLPKHSITKKEEIRTQFQNIKRIVHRSILGNTLSEDWNPVLPFVENKFKEYDWVFEKIKYLASLTVHAGKLSMHEMVLSRLISDIANSGFPRELNFKKSVKPADKKGWIRQEFIENRKKFDKQQDWGKATSEKFKKTFDTPIGSSQSMIMYGNPEYEGLR